VRGPEQTRYEDHIDLRGTEHKGTVIGKVDFRQEAPAPTALDSLPARAQGFTGRDEELGRLLDALSGTPQAVLVTAVSGLGGIGKTALAVAAAHAARKRGWFPGGTLFVDLHGYDEAPVTADQALQSLLRALGVEPEHIPPTADERAALYRSMLARRGEERGAVLILADNASSPDQVLPLLPGDSPHRVLVTSRDRLPQLGARLVPLGQLRPQASDELLDLALRIASPDDSRIADDPEGAGRLAEFCGHLPLALQIAAALLAGDPGMPVAELVDELAESRDRLDHLDDGARSVRAAFDLSYRRLPEARARLLRLLALAPGPEVSDEVAATLVGADAPPTRDLKALARAHLVERGSGRGWWRLHDLVRAFGVAVGAADAAVKEEGEAARRRVMDFFLRWARAADDWLRWAPGKPEPELFEDRAQALAWLDRERAALVAAVSWGSEAQHAGPAGRLYQDLVRYLQLRRHLDDLITTVHAGREAAQRLGDRTGEGVAWAHLGIAFHTAGRMEESIEASTRACDLFQAVDHRRYEAQARANLGTVLWVVGRKREAFEAHARAHELYASLGEGVGGAQSWANLGLLLEGEGQWEEAVEANTRARDLYRAAGDRHNEAKMAINLGNALCGAGRMKEAIDAAAGCLEVFREYEDWCGLGQALYNVGNIHREAQRPEEARAFYLQAAEAFARGNVPCMALRAALTSPLRRPSAPTGTPAPASPPARTPASAQPSPPPPDAPDTAEP
jgi:tetratricopeptide (TPR) repeat protein